MSRTRKNLEKIVVKKVRPRGTPAPPTRVIPNPKKEALKRLCREKVEPDETES